MTRMKIICVYVLIFMATSILDRSYYDALCISFLWFKSCPLAPQRKIFEKRSENYLKSIILIETQDPSKDFSKSTMVTTPFNLAYETLYD